MFGSVSVLFRFFFAVAVAVAVAVVAVVGVEVFLAAITALQRCQSTSGSVLLGSVGCRPAAPWRRWRPFTVLYPL